jgi:Glycosyl hydrolase family 76
MVVPSPHRLTSRTRQGLIATALAGLAWACACALAGPAADATIAARARGSAYPAGATRPLVVARPSRLARASTAAGRGSSKGRSKKRKPKPILTGNPARALIAFEAMQNAYYIRGSGLYEGEPFSFLWPFSQALAATVTLANVSGIAKVPGLGATLSRELQARLIGLGNYLDVDNSGAPEGSFTSHLSAFDATVAPPAGPGGTKFYDDNEWVGIELVRIYKLTHDSAALGSAEAIMAFVMAGWDASPELACPGGVPFSNSLENTERNAVTDAPGAELALDLYLLTGQTQYLQFATMAYEWVRACLLQSNGLYADHIGSTGKVADSFWSYNQGSMVGAGVLLYQATHNGAYLYQARQTAKAALLYYTLERLNSENPFFVSVYFRNMLYLDSVTHDPPGPKLAQAYVNYAWQHLRLNNDLFVHGSPPAGELLDQAAIVQIYGLLSSSPSTYF